MRFILLLLSFLQLLWVSHAQEEDTLDAFNYTHHATLHDGKVSLHWQIVDDEEIHLAVLLAEQPEAGWISFGLSDAGGMKGADMVVWEAANPGVLKDYYSLDYGPPVEDTCESDWVLVATVDGASSLARQAATPVIGFHAIRQLDTKDAQDWAFRDDSRWDVQPTKVIVAWGDQEEMGYHGNNRISTTMRFFAASTNESDNKNNLQHLEEISDGSFLVTARDFSIPTLETTYHDFCMDLPEVATNQAIHIVGIAFDNSLNTMDTYPYVHHFSAFGNPTVCNGESGYDATNIFYGWGPGQEPLVLPEGVGIPIGGDSAFRSLALQIHYNNPNGVAGLVDNTGIRVFYVLEALQHQAAAMVVGDGNLGLIGQSVGSGPTSHRFTCPSSCTEALFDEPITIFAEALHQHETGQRSVNQIIRDQRVVHQASVEVWDYPHNK